MKVFCKEFITVWTRGLVSWLSRKFDSISIDLTPVEEKLDEVKSDVADVKTAVEHIDFSTLAKEQTLTMGLQSLLTELYPKATTAQLNTATQQILTAIGQIDFSSLAKQGTNADATLTAVLEALTGSDDPSPDIPEGVAERLAAIMQFFNISGTVPEYTALTPAEAIAIARDCQYNVMGTDWPIPTWLPTGVTEAQVESAAEGLGIPYHEPTQTA